MRVASPQFLGSIVGVSDRLPTWLSRAQGDLAFVVVGVHAGAHHPHFALHGRLILSVSLITHDMS